MFGVRFGQVRSFSSPLGSRWNVASASARRIFQYHRQRPTVVPRRVPRAHAISKNDGMGTRNVLVGSDRRWLHSTITYRHDLAVRRVKVETDPDLPATDMEFSMTNFPNLPLAGIVVLNFGQVVQGPYATLTAQTARSSLIRRKASLMIGFNSLLRDN